MGDVIRNWFNNDELKILVEKFGTTDKTKIQKLVKEKILEENQTLNIDDKIKQLRARRLEAQCRIDEHRASYLETFGSTPSPQAEKVIKTYHENRPLTTQEYENVLKYITLKNHNFKWHATCDICKEGETYDTRHDAIHDMMRHLSTEHAKKVMELR